MRRGGPWLFQSARELQAPASSDRLRDRQPGERGDPGRRRARSPSARRDHRARSVRRRACNNPERKKGARLRAHDKPQPSGARERWSSRGRRGSPSAARSLRPWRSRRGWRERLRECLHRCPTSARFRPRPRVAHGSARPREQRRNRAERLARERTGYLSRIGRCFRNVARQQRPARQKGNADARRMQPQQSVKFVHSSTAIVPASTARRNEWEMPTPGFPR